MTPLEILTNIGKLVALMGVTMFVGVSFLAQVIFWRTVLKYQTVRMPPLPKRTKALYNFGKWEFLICTGAAVLMVLISIVKVLWTMVTTGW